MKVVALGRFLGIAGILAVALAACSGDDDDSSSAQTLCKRVSDKIAECKKQNPNVPTENCATTGQSAAAACGINCFVTASCDEIVDTEVNLNVNNNFANCLASCSTTDAGSDSGS